MAPMTDYDLAIVGGGPAGLAAGIRARQLGLGAVVYEPQPAPVDKACGEGLMPAALEVLADLGVDPATLGGVSFDGVRYRDADDEQCAAEGVFPSGCGRGVRRVELHRALRRRAEEAGVDFRDTAVEEFEVGDDAVRLDGAVAEWMVGADGLHSDVRRRAGLGGTAVGPRRYGVRRHYRTAPWTSFVEVQWSSAGEAYVTPVGPDRVGVAILSEDGGRFDDLIEAFPNVERRIDGAEPTSEDRGAGPFLQRASSVRSGRLLLVGDAAGYVDALTGEGIALAVETATAAVEALTDGDPERYPAEWRRITRTYRWMTGALIGVTQLRILQRPLIDLLDQFPALFDGSLELLGGADTATPAAVSSRSRPTAGAAASPP